MVAGKEHPYYQLIVNRVFTCNRLVTATALLTNEVIVLNCWQVGTFDTYT